MLSISSALLENTRMEASLIESLVRGREAILRLGSFGAIFVVMLLWELHAPRRLCGALGNCPKRRIADTSDRCIALLLHIHVHIAT